MTDEQFIQQLVIERFKFHLAHLTAVLHTQGPDDDDGIEASAPAEPSAMGKALGVENASALLRAMSEDLSLLERCLEQKIEAAVQG